MQGSTMHLIFMTWKSCILPYLATQIVTSCIINHKEMEAFCLYTLHDSAVNIVSIVVFNAA